MNLRPLFLVLLLMPSAASAQQGFTCPFGTQAACLDYGETVCSSSGQCVSEDAMCFDRYQCDYEGFTCKSNLTDCADEYDRLLSTHNSLVDDYNDLLASSRDLQASFEEAVGELEDARREVIYVRDALDNVVSCIEGLGSFGDPTNCLP
jgi:hypothetical protein